MSNLQLLCIVSVGVFLFFYEYWGIQYRHETLVDYIRQQLRAGADHPLGLLTVEEGFVVAMEMFVRPRLIENMFKPSPLFEQFCEPPWDEVQGIDYHTEEWWKHGGF